MQGLWYGDRRDLVKWGTLIHLAKANGIYWIFQVAYLRHLKLKTEEKDIELPKEVWNHFSDLRHIKSLGDATGLEIIVLDQTFNPLKRHYYISSISLNLKEIKTQKIVFLDPDTGIAPKKAKAEHVTEEDMKDIWAVLLNDDLLVVYQHANRTKTWLSERIKKMSSALAINKDDIKHIYSKAIAPDMAMLWCQKGSKNKLAKESERIISNKMELIAGATPQPKTCPCGCDQRPKKGVFRPGHDKRVSEWIKQIDRKEKKHADFPDHIIALYTEWVKAGKPGGSNPRLVDILIKGNSKKSGKI